MILHDNSVSPVILQDNTDCPILQYYENCYVVLHDNDNRVFSTAWPTDVLMMSQM